MVYLLDSKQHHVGSLDFDRFRVIVWYSVLSTILSQSTANLVLTKSYRDRNSDFGGVNPNQITSNRSAVVDNVLQDVQVMTKSYCREIRSNVAEIET